MRPQGPVCCAAGSDDAILYAQAAQAGGLRVYEIVAPDPRFAGAGMAAGAEDASTVDANPTGMTRLAAGDRSVLRRGANITVSGKTRMTQSGFLSDHARLKPVPWGEESNAGASPTLMQRTTTKS